MTVRGRSAQRRPPISIIGLTVLSGLLVVDWKVIDLLIEVSRWDRTFTLEMYDARKVLTTLALSVPPMASLVAFGIARGLWELWRRGRCPPFLMGFVLFGGAAVVGVVVGALVVRVDLAQFIWDGVRSALEFIYRKWRLLGLIRFVLTFDFVLIPALTIFASLVPQLTVATLGGYWNERRLGLTLVIDRDRGRRSANASVSDGETSGGSSRVG